MKPRQLVGIGLKSIAGPLLIAALMTLVQPVVVSAGLTGTWTQLSNAYPGKSAQLFLLLTDGTVIAQDNDNQSWYKLTPDANGNYATGTWSKIASMPTSMASGASNVLPNGKVLYIGGESGFASSSVFVYDPVKDTWTQSAYPETFFEDGVSLLLPTGQVLCGSAFTSTTYLYDPTKGTFTQSGTKSDTNDETEWVLMPGGNVLTYNFFGTGEIYTTSKGTWSLTNTPPSIDVGISNGPQMRLPNGSVIFFGNSESAIYNPTAGTWTTGPTCPTGSYAGFDDVGGSGVMTPDGYLMFLKNNGGFTANGMLCYDYNSNSISDITSQLPPTLVSEMAGFGFPNGQRMTILPNGHILFSTGLTTNVWDFATSGSPQKAWQPTIASIVAGTGTSAGTYTLTGTQLTGFCQGAVTTDGNVDCNYPIIRITSPSKTVYTAKTTNWTPGVSNTALSTVNFTLPTTFPSKTSTAYQLVVWCNGIPSQPYTFVYPVAPPVLNYVSSVLTTTTTPPTLTLTGDTYANQVVITQRGTIVTVAGASQTLIGNSKSASQQVTYNISGDFKIVGNFAQNSSPPTSDNVTLVSVASSNAAFTFGTGNDAMNLTYCNLGSFSMNGGTGTNTIALVANKITGSTTLTNVVIIP